MSETFVYRPKFIDVRVKPPRDGEREARPGERVCDQTGCRHPGSCKAPANVHTGEVLWFCETHAAEYNRNWNFFEHLSEAEQAAFAANEAHGHRPTWSFTHGRPNKAKGRNPAFGDNYDLFGKGGARAHPASPQRRVSELQARALEQLGLEEGASPEIVRARYSELIKRYHPDSNGGDRSLESHLHKTIKSYQILKSAGMA